MRPLPSFFVHTRGGALMSTALTLFHSLCDIGNSLSTIRDTYEPCSDRWTQLTCLLLALDEAIDLLVHSDGLDEEDTP
jgi:hypothetical protein